ncbi:S9 family peptidase [Halorientalis sp. IM1011]|uniref:S9 family peptidase n=1 Tax=Halorientalis sp. IM1011 TaxID=1932360 RepID=UPI00097CC9E7|nr:S9 family peptidase [Halorientalis sp. IM1011]AQL41934.1 S9 family peptidase [Halorientalis sp. IM1011]
MHDLERYLNVRSAYGASVGPEGTVAFLMDTTGTPQIWTLDEPGGWPEQRTFYDERVTFCSFSPERRELAFGMDEGGDEFTQLFRLDLDSGEVTPLTATPDAIHYWGGWSHDGDRLAFAANRRDESVFDVYVQGRDEHGDEAELVHEGDGWLALAGWSPDDDRLLVTEHASSFDKDLYVLDLDSGDIEHVTPHEGEVRYDSPSWGPDGEAIYCCTDWDSDTLRLERLDLDTGEFEVVEDGGEWNVDGIALDDETGNLAYSRNVDGYTEITVGELTGATTYETRPGPDLPDGTAGGVSFSPDADRFALSASSRTDNTNVHVVEFENGDTERWTRASTAGIPRSSFREPELVHYETFDDREIPAYFTLPDQENRPSDGVPVVVDIHGGPESQRRPSFSGLTQYFLSRGYAVFEPNVRGSTGYGTAYTHLDDVEKRMDSVKDIRAAVDWLAEHPAVDPDRIVAKGGSYGGFMVLAAMTEYPDLWAAGVDSVGIANFVTFLENTGAWRREHREAEYGSLEDDREFLESISPIHDADRIDAPLFVLHGANDPRVPVGEAEQIAAEVETQGVPVEKLIFEDEGHGISKLDNRIEAYTAVVDFLDRHV